MVYGYQWERCSHGVGCSPISGATSSTYSLVEADVGQEIEVVVTASNGAGSADAGSSLAGPVQGPPSEATPPLVSGTSSEGDTLEVTDDTWDGYPSPSLSYQWQRCAYGGSCSDIADANGQTYALSSSDVGDTLDVVVTATNDLGSDIATSGPTSTILKAGEAQPPLDWQSSDVLQGGAVEGASCPTSSFCVVASDQAQSPGPYYLGAQVFTSTSPSSGSNDWVGTTVVPSGDT
jgi:hypothetical protein